MDNTSEVMLSDGNFSILFGGQSPEHPASVSSFENVLDSFKKERLDGKIISIYYFTKDGSVLFNDYSAEKKNRDYIELGVFYDINTAIKKLSTERTFHINLLHGNLGEDGHIQGVAKYFRLMGSYGSVLPSSLAMSKYHMAHFVSSIISSIQMPETIFLNSNNYHDALGLIKNTFSNSEVVIKPNSLGASLFTNKYLINKYTEDSVCKNINKIFEYDNFGLIQKFVYGTEYSVGCVNLRGDIIGLPVVEIKTIDGFFGHEEKHKKNKAQEIVHINDTPITIELKRLAIEIFESTGFEYMCRFDFIVTEYGDIYFLEANPIPGLMMNSIFPKMLKEKGISIPDLFYSFKSVQQQMPSKEVIIDYTIE